MQGCYQSGAPRGRRVDATRILGSTSTVVLSNRLLIVFATSLAGIAYFCNPNYDRFIDAIPGTYDEAKGKKYEGINR